MINYCELFQRLFPIQGDHKCLNSFLLEEGSKTYFILGALIHFHSDMLWSHMSSNT